jgi:hypothetical protein
MTLLMATIPFPQQGVRAEKDMIRPGETSRGIVAGSSPSNFRKILADSYPRDCAVPFRDGGG